MDRGFDRLRSAYGRSLRLVLRHRLAVLGAFVAVLAATVEVFGVVPKGFIPDTDNDTLSVNLQTAQGTSFYEQVGYVQRIADLIRQNPYVVAQMANAGGGGLRRRVHHPADAPRHAAPDRAADRAAAPGTARALPGVPRLRHRAGVAPDRRASGATAATTSPSRAWTTTQLFEWAPRLEAAIAELPAVQDVSDNMEIKSPRVNMTINRDKAAAIGLTATQITQTAVQRVRPAAGRHDLRRSDRSTACCWSWIRSTRNGPSR